MIKHGRASHLLQMLHLNGIGCAFLQDVVVVVSRWFGGVLLGPQRFSIINNTARLLLEACGHDKRHASKSRPTSRHGSVGSKK